MFAMQEFAAESQNVQAVLHFSSLRPQPKVKKKEGRVGPSTHERDAMLLGNVTSVRFIARRIHERLPQHVEMDDLISAGVVGLIDAYAKFDHKKDVQFKSYAQFRIRGAILDSLRLLDWGPRELRRKGRAIEDASRCLTQQLSRTPNDQEMADAMKLKLADYQHLSGEIKGLEVGSLNAERTEDSGDEEIAHVPASVQEDPLFRCLNGEMRQHLADAMEALPERERTVLRLYYFEEMTMKQIGHALTVVESRVSQIHSAAVKRLRSAMEALRAPQMSAA